jgi:pimeloyl-ACP methyl ester carboxylesterase
MATIVHKGIKLAYEDRGAGKPPFVFVHGWTCDRSFFAPQVEHFARRHRVVSLDLRGHGESDQPEGQYSIAAYADDIAYVIEQLGLDKAVAVGHSMGGIAVLQLAAAHPDCVAAIVMIDPAPFVSPPELRAGIEGMIAAIESGDQEPRRQFIANYLFLPTSDRRLVEGVLAVMMAAPSRVAASAMRGILDFDGPAQPLPRSARFLRSTWRLRRRSTRRISCPSGCPTWSMAGLSALATSINWRCPTR